MVLKGRPRFLRLIVVLALMVLASRLVWIQVVKAEEIALKGEELRVQRRVLEPMRGAILDRNGQTLAHSVPTYIVVANPFLMEDEDEREASKELAQHLGMTAEQILAVLHKHAESGYVELKKNLNLEQKKTIEALKLPHISMVMEPQRLYPEKMTANQILGYLSDKRGAYGLEARYEQELAGVPGHIVAEFSNGGIPLESTIKEQVESVPGANLVLTLDASLNQFVEQKLDEIMKELKPDKAGVIAMDPHTGEILVWASRPGADPGDRTTWGDPIDYNRLNDWMAGSRMSPGSIFKTITTAAALEEKAITLNTLITDEGRIMSGGWPILNWDLVVPATPEPKTIFQHMHNSSNVALIKVGRSVGRDNWVKYMRGFGFMEKTGIDLSYENEANFGDAFAEKTESDWDNMYIGQHLEVTPVQMITAVAAIANGGKLVQPHFVKEIQDPTGKTIWTAPTAPKRQVISEETAREVREIMQSVIENGTANLAQPACKCYTVAGKTGTAQKFDLGTGQIKSTYLADFVGFSPAQDPKVIVLVLLDEPKVPQGYGGTYAAPLFSKLLPEIMQRIGAPPDKGTPDAEQPSSRPTVGLVPDVSWYPVALAQEQLTAAGFTVRTVGQGPLVGAQSLKPGTQATAGTTIELSLAPSTAADGSVTVPRFIGLSLVEANRLATDLGLNLKATGTGFVTSQSPDRGATVPARSAITVELKPR